MDKHAKPALREPPPHSAVGAHDKNERGGEHATHPSAHGPSERHSPEKHTAAPAKLKIDHEAQAIAARDASIARYMPQWINWMKAHGIKRSQPINPLGVEADITSGFGFRDVEGIDGATGKNTPHLGIDLRPHDKSLLKHPVPVLNSVRGLVLFAGYCDAHSGHAIVIAGENGKIYSYAHLTPHSVKVHAGQEVARGAPIAEMGRSGTASAPCLHFVERQIKALDDASRDRHDHWKADEAAFIADTKKHHKPGEKRMTPPTTAFDSWSWKHAIGDNKDMVTARIVKRGLEWAEQHLNGGKPMTSLDVFDRAPPRIFWTVNPYKAGSVRANTADDTSPQPHLTPDGRKNRVNPPEQSWGEYLYQGLTNFFSGSWLPNLTTSAAAANTPPTSSAVQIPPAQPRPRQR